MSEDFWDPVRIRAWVKRFVYVSLLNDKECRKRAQIALRRHNRESVQARRRTPLLHNGKKARR